MEVKTNKAPYTQESKLKCARLGSSQRHCSSESRRDAALRGMSQHFDKRFPAWHTSSSLANLVSGPCAGVRECRSWLLHHITVSVEEGRLIVRTLDKALRGFQERAEANSTARGRSDGSFVCQLRTRVATGRTAYGRSHASSFVLSVG